MRAVGILKSLPVEAVDAFHDLDLPMLALGDHDILVRVEAVSVNPADYRSRSRKADDGQFKVLGWDAAGTIIQKGSMVERFAVGQDVYYAGDIERPGTNSAFHAVDARIVGVRPRQVTMEEAAALPLVSLTAWEALFDRFCLQRTGGNRHRSILILGGAGGVGSMAIQFARLVPDLHVIASASRPETEVWCQNLGAHAIVDHSQPLLPQLRATGLETVDMVLILNAPDYHFDAVAECVSPQGMICCIVPFQQRPDLNLLMRKSASFHWELMFTRPLFQTADLQRQGAILNEVAQLVDDGSIRSPLTSILKPFNKETVRQAHAALETNQTIGKIVITDFGHESDLETAS